MTSLTVLPLVLLAAQGARLDGVVAALKRLHVYHAGSLGHVALCRGGSHHLRCEYEWAVVQAVTVPRAQSGYGRSLNSAEACCTPHLHEHGVEGLLGGLGLGWVDEAAAGGGGASQGQPLLRGPRAPDRGAQEAPHAGKRARRWLGGEGAGPGRNRTVLNTEDAINLETEEAAMGTQELNPWQPEGGAAGCRRRGSPQEAQRGNTPPPPMLEAMRH